MAHQDTSSGTITLREINPDYDENLDGPYLQGRPTSSPPAGLSLLNATTSLALWNGLVLPGTPRPELYTGALGTGNREEVMLLSATSRKFQSIVPSTVAGVDTAESTPVSGTV